MGDLLNPWQADVFVLGAVLVAVGGLILLFMALGFQPLAMRGPRNQRINAALANPRFAAVIVVFGLVLAGVAWGTRPAFLMGR